jgi:hypothetical protein
VKRLLFKVHLVLYFSLIAWAIVTLNRADVLGHIPSWTLVLAIICVAGLGILAAMTAGQGRGAGRIGVTGRIGVKGAEVRSRAGEVCAVSQ